MIVPKIHGPHGCGDATRVVQVVDAHEPVGNLVACAVFSLFPDTSLRESHVLALALGIWPCLSTKFLSSARLCVARVAFGDL